MPKSKNVHELGVAQNNGIKYATQKKKNRKCFSPPWIFGGGGGLGGRKVASFDSRWCRWDFSLTSSFQPHCGPGVRCVGLTTLPLSHIDCLEFWELQPSVNLKACPEIA